MTKDGKKLEKEEKIMENNENKLDEAMLEDVSGGCVVMDMDSRGSDIYSNGDPSILIDYIGRR